jgi:hypothetical protein
MEVFASAVKLVLEVVAPAPGFDIMQRLIKKPKGPGSGGFGAVRKLERRMQQRPDTPPEPNATEGFSIVKNILDNPTPVKKPQ